MDCGPFELIPKFTSWSYKDQSSYFLVPNVIFHVEAVNNVTLSSLSFRVDNVDFGEMRFTSSF